MMKEKPCNKMGGKNILKDKPVINQPAIADIGFGTMLAAVLVHRVDPADYIGCG